VPAIRLSAGEQFRIRLLAAGELNFRAGPGQRLRTEFRLQLQWRTPPESADQREYDSRRFDGEQLRSRVGLGRDLRESIHRQRLRRFTGGRAVGGFITDELF